MRNDLPYFSHDNNASLHPKMSALIQEFGYEGYGRFWALNENIARSEGAFLDISRKIYKSNLASTLKMKTDELEVFITYLSDPDIDLINFKDGIITTDRITELHKKAVAKRKKQRKDENAEIVDDFDTEENRIEENREEENKEKQRVNNSDELSQSMKEAISLASLLLTSHRKEFPDFLSAKNDQTTITSWAKDIERLIRLDKKPPDIIKSIILWVKTPDNFWFSNIESGKTLRKRYERLYAQMSKENNKYTEQENYRVPLLSEVVI